jgi:protein-S-isoprenylcysteine O-methyltransferase Ste14
VNVLIIVGYFVAWAGVHTTLTGLPVMWLMPKMTVNLLALFVGTSLCFFVGSLHEEQLLTRQFGSQYEKYRRRVPRIVPGIRPLGIKRLPR